VDGAIAPLDQAVGEEGEVYDISQIDFDLLRREFARSKQQRTLVQNLRQAVEQRLAKLLAANPLRTDFQKHYETIVDAYNKEKDRATIEKTFQEMLQYIQKLDVESTRAMREGLDEESLALFDILRKPDLDKNTIAQLKQVASSLLETLKAEKLKIDHWRDKEATRDAVQIVIKNFLWNDQTGLPVESYTEEDVEEKSEEVFRHVWRAYPYLPSPVYAL
jgi:type I restriction enzyme R subunit